MTWVFIARDGDEDWIDMLYASPVAIVSDNQETSLYRVMLYAEERDGKNFYTVYTGDNMTRIFSETDLPDDVRSKLSMVKAYSINNHKEPTESPGISSLDAYMNSFPKEYDDIGWRVNRCWYCIIMSRDLLLQMRGQAATP